jgi:NADPH:quinone reductase-like Zn-dependent oxidoreductase
LKQVLRLLSHGIRRKARRRGVGYAFVFMRADGAQLREIASLAQAGFIAPVVDKVYPFDATAEALAYVDSGRAKGKVVIKVRWRKAL